MNTPKALHGFTIIELLIVITIIAILSTLAIVTYRDVQKNAIAASIKQDLKNVATAISMENVRSHNFAPTIPSGFQPSSGVALTLVPMSSGPSFYYEDLAPRQDATLLFDLCADLISEGYGQNSGEGSNYISECRVFNTTQIDIQGWNARNINVPITTQKLYDYVSSYVGGSTPEFNENATAFMDEWIARFNAQGGTWPVTGFWDSWATPVNGGIMKPELPEPTLVPGGEENPSDFCVEAYHSNFPNEIYHITKSLSASPGNCG